MSPFTDQKPKIATKKDCEMEWSGGKNGKYFRCYMCGYKFVEGDYWRWVYTNDIPDAGGNPLVCKECDGPDVRERWRTHKKELRTKYWWVNRIREF